MKTLSKIVVIVAAGFSSPALAQADPRQSFPQVDTMSPHGVNLQTGTFQKEGVDLTIGPLTVDHYLASRVPGPLNGNPLPAVIATSLSGRVTHYESTGPGGTTNVVKHVMLGKLKLTFNVLGTGGFFPLDSANTGWKMVTSGTQLVLTNKSGETYTFVTHPSTGALGRLIASKSSADGHKQTWTYDSSGRMKKVVSNRGYAVVIDYNTSAITACGYNLANTNPAQTNSCAASNYKVSYGVNSTGYLTSITALDGSVTTLSYGANNGGGPTCVSLPNSSTCAIQNTYGSNLTTPGFDSPGQVVSQQTAEGDVWTYTHIGIENFPGDYIPGLGEIRRNYSVMAPPGGGISSPGTTNLTFGNGFVESVVAPDGSATYEYSTLGAYFIAYSSGWSGPHYYSVFPSKITYPEGNSVSFNRDWADNVISRWEIPKSGDVNDANITAWTYPTSYKWSSPTICATANVLCDKPTKVTDPNNKATDYTYHATHGGMLTKTEPAATNGIRPQTRYTYTARYARDVNGTALSPPIYVLTAEEYCKTTAASGSGCAGGAADEVVTTYDYGPTSGPNNLLLKGTVVDSGGLNLRTCYKYDQYGRKIAETQPLGTGSSCP